MGSFDASNTRCDGEDFAAAISSGSSDEIAGEGFWDTAGEGFKDDIAEAIRVKAGELEQVQKNKVEYNAARDAQVTKEAIDYAVGQGMRFDE